MIYRLRFRKVSLLFIVTAAAVMLGTGGAMSADVEIDMDGVLDLIGKYTAGHACPVYDGYALTAAHVIDVRWEDRNFPLIPYRFSNEKGDYGLAQPLTVFAHADIGWLKLLPGPVGSYEMSERTPKEDDKVFWVEYETGKKNEAFKAKRRDAKIINVVAGHLFLDQAPISGASGGCLFNEYGEVIGIVTAGWKIGNAYEPNVGEAVAVYGDWMPLHPKEKPVDDKEKPTEEE